jgi:preprotein translocase subunit SecD
VNRRNHIVTLVAVVLLLGLAGAYLATGARPRLGLDLRGGISAVYTPVLAEGQERPEDFDDVLDETINVIRSRVDALGVAEPEISRQGDDVLVQLPGVDDADRAREIIGTTAKLTFRRVEAIVAPGEEGYDETPPCDGVQEDLADDESGLVCAAPIDVAELTGEDTEEAPDAALLPKYRVGPAELTGDQVTEAFATLGEGGGWAVSLELDDAGGEAFQQVTADLACERDQGQGGLFAIVLDNYVESAPGVNQSVPCGVGIAGGQASISVGSAGTAQDSGQAEAQDLALVLKTGALPITLEPSTFETVSPTLGAESLRSGLLAAALGLLLVSIYLVFFYRWLGLVAIGALTIFGVVSFTIVSLLGAAGFTLTLAGIAGLVVSIGITADSSIIFYERLRDEVGLGKTVRTGAKRAFESAFRTNLAGNTVTLAAAIILYFLAVGPVRGFALTLGISTVLDIIILATYSRAAVGLLSNTRLLTRGSVRAATSETVTGGNA